MNGGVSKLGFYQPRSKVGSYTKRTENATDNAVKIHRKIQEEKIIMLKVQIITWVLTVMECKIFKVSSLRCITPYRLFTLKQNITSGGINPCQE